MMIDNPVVICDTREKQFFQLEFYGFEVIHQKLRTGDYSIQGKEDFISIDRKASISELVQNLFYGYTRFKKEMIRASDILHFFLVCEFPFSYVEIFPHGSNIPRSKWHNLRATTKGIIHKLDLLYHDYNVKTIFCANRQVAEEKTGEILNKVINNESLHTIEFFQKDIDG